MAIDESADAATAGVGAGRVTEADAPESEKRAVLWVTNTSHAVNHFQGGVLPIFLVAVVQEFGVSDIALGVYNAIRSSAGSLLQGFYGFLTPFMRKTRILALGNFIMAIGVALSALAGSFWPFVGARAVVDVGSSPQHPVGASLLSGYFPKRRGFILSLNTSIAATGGLLGPLVAPLLISAYGWRDGFLIVAAFSAVIGLAYLVVGRRVPSRAPARAASDGSRLKEGLKNYKLVLRNRNMLVVSLVMMVGAAGRGGGINDTFLVLHLTRDLGLTLAIAGVAKAFQQGGGIAGPIGLGWLSDRLSRKRVLQASLLLSAVGSWVVAWMGPSLLPLFISLFMYGVFTHSRMTLTQAIIADSVPEEERDAAFSSFFFIGFLSVPFWGLAVGVLMQLFSFSVAFTVIASSYVLGAAMMSFLEDKKPA